MVFLRVHEPALEGTTFAFRPAHIHTSPEVSDMYRWERIASPDVIKDSIFEVEAPEVVKRRVWPGGPYAGIEAARTGKKTPTGSEIRIERRSFPR
jgi:hypothetical protein